MYNSIQAGIDTRNLYRFENKYSWPKHMIKIRSMSVLRRMANRIMKSPPKIVANKGTYYGGRYLSYQCDEGIFLARNQREYLTLIHEIVHAMGYDYHDSKFTKVYFNLLVKMFGLDKNKLINDAREYGVSI